ncbi:MAG: deoxyribodipyrimidine photo-lyase [Planctomycetes bacterium]|nr:deoxyribodipyrimidine photo-lyase [Planctomycetota bacterium]
MWFRRDLRLDDNAALAHALRQCGRVYGVFVFDREILDLIEDKADRRVELILQCISEIDRLLRQRGSRLIVLHGKATEEIPQWAAQLGVDAVYANHDYEPRRIARDEAVRSALASQGRTFKTYKDHVIFEKSEILNKSGLPFRVYTQYKNAWRAALSDDAVAAFDCDGRPGQFAAPLDDVGIKDPTLDAIGFKKTNLAMTGSTAAARGMFHDFLRRIDGYGETRDLPGITGTSRLSVHLRFGTISIRELVREASDVGGPGATKWVDELIWREFYNMILHHFPHTQTRAFQPAYEALPWRHDEPQFAAWCDGRTGYPIVDAGMRELNTTGYMHNRLRMITANFLTKDLRIDWRWGERYFARKLLDYDLSQNLGGWQWSASIGTDAQPYFRIMNPVLQSRKFDADGAYIRQYVPELAGYSSESIHAPWEADSAEQARAGCIIGKDYPSPMVDHHAARAAALAMFKAVKENPGVGSRG